MINFIHHKVVETKEKEQINNLSTSDVIDYHDWNLLLPKMRFKLYRGIINKNMPS